MPGRLPLPWIVGALFLAVLATTRYYGFDARETHHVASDSYHYLSIAGAAPHLPVERQMYNHAQRLPLPYLIGLVHRVVPLTFDWLFRITSALLLAAALAIFATALTRARIDPNIVLAVTALCAFNPYLVRMPLAFGGLVDQPLFFAGTALMVWAVLEERPGLLIVSAVIAEIGRQTAMTFLPALLLLAAWRRRWSPVIAGALIIAVYYVSGVIAEPFSDPSINGTTVTGLFHDLGRVSLRAFASYFAECATPLVASLLLLLFVRDVRAAVALVLGDARVATLLLLALGILGSPVLMGPAIGFGNGARLSALALPPLLAALALQLDRAGVAFVRSPVFAAGVTLCAFLGSLHHIYTPLGLSRWMFGAISVVSLAGLTVLAAAARLRPRAALVRD